MQMGGKLLTVTAIHLEVLYKPFLCFLKNAFKTFECVECKCCILPLV